MTRDSRIKDEKCNRYGRLVVTSRAQNPPYSTNIHWHCKCDCGNSVIVCGSKLRNGNTKSCGCLQKKNCNAKLGKSGKLSPSYRYSNKCGRNTKEQNDFHEKIRARDNYTCQECGKTQEQELLAVCQILSVHHKNGKHNDNRDENAVTLCEVCHQLKTAEQYKQRNDDRAIEVAFLADDMAWFNEQLKDYI